MPTLTQAKTAPLSPQDAQLAESSRLTLSRLVGQGEQENIILRLSVERPGEETAEISLPGAVLPLFLFALQAVSHNNVGDTDLEQNMSHAERHRGLDELVAEAQSLGMY